MKETSRPKSKTAKYLVVGLLSLVVVGLLIGHFYSNSQKHREAFGHADTLLKNLYTIDADAIIAPSAEEVEALYTLYVESMRAGAAENLLLNRTPTRIATAVRQADGTTRFVDAVYESEGATRYVDAVYESEGGNSEQYGYVATVVLTVNGESREIYPTGKVRIGSDGMVTGFSEVRGIAQLIDEIAASG